jgi:hypothetical protein
MSRVDKLKAKATLSERKKLMANYKSNLNKTGGKRMEFAKTLNKDQKVDSRVATNAIKRGDGKPLEAYGNYISKHGSSM